MIPTRMAAILTSSKSRPICNGSRKAWPPPARDEELTQRKGSPGSLFVWQLGSIPELLSNPIRLVHAHIPVALRMTGVTQLLQQRPVEAPRLIADGAILDIDRAGRIRYHTERAPVHEIRGGLNEVGGTGVA